MSDRYKIDKYELANALSRIKKDVLLTQIAAGYSVFAVRKWSYWAVWLLLALVLHNLFGFTNYFSLGTSAVVVFVVALIDVQYVTYKAKQIEQNALQVGFFDTDVKL